MTSSEAAASRSKLVPQTKLGRGPPCPRILRMHGYALEKEKASQSGDSGALACAISIGLARTSAEARTPKESGERREFRPIPGPGLARVLWIGSCLQQGLGLTLTHSCRILQAAFRPLPVGSWPPLEGCWRPCGAAASFRRCPELLSGKNPSIFQALFVARGMVRPWHHALRSQHERSLQDFAQSGRPDQVLRGMLIVPACTQNSHHMCICVYEATSCVKLELGKWPMPHMCNGVAPGRWSAYSSALSMRTMTCFRDDSNQLPPVEMSFAKSGYLSSSLDKRNTESVTVQVVF